MFWWSRIELAVPGRSGMHSRYKSTFSLKHLIRLLVVLDRSGSSLNAAGRELNRFGPVTENDAFLKE